MFFLNGENLGSATATNPCMCNSDEQRVSFAGRDVLFAWRPGGPNTIGVEAVGSTSSYDLAIGYIRADVETTASAGTFVVFDAAGGDAAPRNICYGLVWEGQQDLFDLTLK